MVTPAIHTGSFTLGGFLPRILGVDDIFVKAGNRPTSLRPLVERQLWPAERPIRFAAGSDFFIRMSGLRRLGGGSSQ